MCVSGSGYTLELIATRLIRSVSSFGSVTARIASEFVRTPRPRRSETRGSEPARLLRNSSLLVPSAPAAITTPRAGALGQPEVVLREGVLGVVRAADHAAPARDAARALRPGAAEERVRHGHA